MAAAKTYKDVPVSGTVADFVSAGYGELSSLKEEMDDMESNLSGANMTHMPKYEVASEAAQNLEGTDDEPEVPDVVAGLEVSTSVQVNRDKRRPCSRGVRLSNAEGQLSAAQDALNEWLDDEANAEHKDRDDVETLRDRVEETINNVSGTEFPGMFG